MSESRECWPEEAIPLTLSEMENDGSEWRGSSRLTLLEAFWHIHSQPGLERTFTFLGLRHCLKDSGSFGPFFLSVETAAETSLSEPILINPAANFILSLSSCVRIYHASGVD